MSGKKDREKDKVEYKKKLEHKLYLARESPEPVFDLSDCDLKQVPTGIYSLCRVFLKDVLNLGVNRLTTLQHGGSLSDLKNLMVLDLRNNKFDTITEDIKFLGNLRELYLQDNQLQKLPDSVGLLGKLTVLDVSDNYLVILPESIGNLSKLHTLSIKGNSKLRKLPISFCGLRCLENLTFDPDQFLYPPKEICRAGIEIIIDFIVDDIGIPYENLHARRSSEDFDPRKSSVDPTTQNFERDKQSVMLRVEEEREAMRQQEVKFQEEKRQNQKRLLEDVTLDQGKIDARLSEIQQDKDFEKKKFVNELKAKEHESEKAICKFMEQTKLSKTQASQQLDFDRREHTRLFEDVKKSDKLKRDEILEGMKTVLEKEKERFEDYNKLKDQTVHTVLLDEVHSCANMDQTIKQKLENNQHLTDQLLQDNELQKMAVGKLLERSDARSWALLQLVNFVSNQLANLTSIELDKRKLKIDEHMNDLAEKRSELCAQLMDLLDKKDKRQSYLLAELQDMDNRIDKDTDFWLLQYQRLVDKQPQLIKNLQRNLEPQFVQEMVMNGVIHCLPFLAPWAHSKYALAKVTDGDLSRAGISKKAERKTILGLLANYTNKGLLQPSSPTSSLPASKPVTPSVSATAPPIAAEPTAPPQQSGTGFADVECVICMDSFCEVVFIPCGHICTCLLCSTSVEICPICRAEILKRVKMHAP
ncbi:E3 ubiquitin-protein ligase LRSAM1-like isoform X2 [Chrysoperla carnea]|uniref:E3 ubiquitin-protein ligase LRSAM1-like isoform X2 n=1 Tax=Chrysoperla carnea TaxID=189513 RepID=UPI001D09043E|nr:E3 ubiquitin-protein ligase LRSAM1-like isoform X2 [Chrysoperla carnea]